MFWVVFVFFFNLQAWSNYKIWQEFSLNIWTTKTQHQSQKKKSQTLIYLKGFKEKQSQYSIKLKSKMLADLCSKPARSVCSSGVPFPSRNPCQYFLNSTTSSKDWTEKWSYSFPLRGPFPEWEQGLLKNSHCLLFSAILCTQMIHIPVGEFGDGRSTEGYMLLAS